MKLRFFGLAALSVIGAGLVVGCSHEEAAEPSSENNLAGDGGTQIEVACNDLTYVAVLKEGPCLPIQGQHGAWKPSPLFPDAPLQFSACVYRWDSPSGDPREKDVIVSAIHPSPNGNALAESCPRETSSGKVGQLMAPDMPADEIPELTPSAPGGTVGCDVCGYVDEGEVYVVLPPDMGLLGEFAVGVSDGSSRAFRVGHVDGVSHAATIDLPVLPEGISYVSGRVRVR